MKNFEKLRVLFSYLSAKIYGRKVCASHVKDVDGIVSASILYSKFKNPIIFLLETYEVGDRFLNLLKWDVVVDLPPFKKMKFYVDHHASNSLFKAEKSVYNPSAKCAAELLFEALKPLSHEEILREAVELAKRTDSASYLSDPPLIDTVNDYDEAWDLNDAVKGLNKEERLDLAKKIVSEGLKALNDEKIQEAIRKVRKVRTRTYSFAEQIPSSEFLILTSKNTFSEEKISFSAIPFILFKKGVKVVLICSLNKGNGKVKCSINRQPCFKGVSVRGFAEKHGGGGHDAASGFMTSLPLEKIIEDAFKWAEQKKLKTKHVNLNTLYPKN